ncbi:MAG: thiamine pyrophosphate-binding protein [Bacteriovorax sp.]|nr:thiamine pyrophosphate-binding protein [Bacteriovorax sp.]
MIAADYISDYISNKNITHVFGVSGANIEDLFNSIYKINKTSIVLAKNEYCAAMMAIGYYLTTKNISIVLTTSGPGIFNTIPVLVEAYSSKIPLVLISGSVLDSHEGKRAFQDTSGEGESVNVLKMLTECTCFQIKVTDVSMIPDALETAFNYAIKFKKPSVIIIPKNIFQCETLSLKDFVTEKEVVINLESSDLAGAISFCQQFLTEGANPPLVILGDRLVHLKEIDSIKKFISLTDANVALTPNSKGLYDHYDSRYLGLIGIMGHSCVIDYLNQTSHVICIGASFDLMSFFGIQEILKTKKVLILNEIKEQGSLFNLLDENVIEVIGDIDTNISLVSFSLQNTHLAIERNPIINNSPDYSDYVFENIISIIQLNLENDANIFVDAGNCGAFVIHHLKTRGNGVFYVSLGMGGMGNSIGAGIGSAIATNKKTYVFLGDGSFLIYGLEIHTTIEYNLPIVYFLFNNNSHGMCTTRESLFLETATGINDFRESRYSEGLGKIFPGLTCYNVFDIESLKLCLGDIRETSSPSIVTINIKNFEIPPFKTFCKN